MSFLTRLPRGAIYSHQSRTPYDAHIIARYKLPGQLVFGRDMLLDIDFQPNWAKMWQRKQNIINYNNKRENSRRVSHDYEVGQYAYILRDGIYRKLEGDKLGPFRITQVFTNGTVRIQRGITNERINIRRLTPHFGVAPP